MGVGAQVPKFLHTLSGGNFKLGQSLPALDGTAEVSDGGSLRYQWMRSTDGGASWVEIAGATAAVYAPPGDSVGTVRYRVRCTNTWVDRLGLTPGPGVYPGADLFPRSAGGSYTAKADSGVAVYTVVDVPAPVFVAPLADLELAQGERGALDGTAAATGTVGYQWQVSGDGTVFTDLAGETGPTLAPNTSVGGVRYYRVRAVNRVLDLETAALSNTARVRVLAASAPVFGARLADAVYDQGDPAAELDGTASAVVGGISYQWQRSGDGVSFADIAGATGPRYAPPTGDGGVVWYRVAAVNTVGTSQVGSVSNAARVTVRTAAVPVFRGELAGGDCDVGTPAAVLDGTAEVGHGTLTYQWQVSGDGTVFADVDGAVAALFTPPTGTGGTAWYRVAVLNRVGTSTASAVSGAAKITVHVAQAPVFRGALAGGNYPAGEVAAALDGTAEAPRGAVSYTWYACWDGGPFAPVAGAAGPTYTPPTEVGGRWRYYVVAVNEVGTSSAESVSNTAEIVVRVADAPVFRGDLAGGVYDVGDTAQVLDGAAQVLEGTLAYRWYVSRDGGDFTLVDGAVGAALQPDTSMGGVLRYYVEAVNTLGTSTARSVSNTAQVTVRAASAPVFAAALEAGAYDAGDPALALDGTATAPYGTVGYQWYRSVDGGKVWEALDGAQGASFTPPTDQGGAVRYFVRAENRVGTSAAAADSNAVDIRVYVAQAPRFLHGLADAAYDSGGAAAALDGTAEAPRGRVAYQWAVSLDGGAFEDLEGETGAVFAPPTHPGGTRWYRVTATNLVGTSAAASVSGAAAITVWVAQAPVFRAPLAGAVYEAGDPADALDGTADAPHGVVNYQWYVNGTPVEGAVGAGFTPSTLVGGVFRCKVVAVNVVGDTVAQAEAGPVEITVLVAQEPRFSLEPAGADYVELDDARPLSARAAADHGSVRYQWYRSGDGAVFVPVDGAAEANYLPPTDAAGRAWYRVEAVNTVGITSRSSVSRTALVTVTAAQVPVFLHTLAGAAYDLALATAKLDGTAQVSDGGSLTYAWYQAGEGEDFQPIPGAVGAKYRPSSLEEGVRRYRVVCTNTLRRSVRSAASNVAEISVTDRRLDDRQRWELYLKTLRTDFVKLCKLEFLNPDGSVAFDIDNRSRRGRTFLQDGNLEVHLQNGMRRQCTVVLANDSGAYDFAVDKLWFGQQVRLWEGLVLPNGEDYYLPQGVFYLSDPDQVVEPGKNTITYHLVDKWAYLDGTLFGNLDGIYEVPLNSNIFTAVASVLALDRGNGLPVDGVPPLFTDYFNGRTVTLPSGQVLPVTNTPYTYRCDGENGTYADVILEMNTMLAGWVGYDQTGRLRIEPSQEDLEDGDKPVLWEFTPAAREWLGYTYTVKNTEVYNDVIVEGASLGDSPAARGRATNQDLRSDTNIFGPLGRRTLRMSAAAYYADQQCRDLAAWHLKRYTVLKKSVTISSTQMFHLVENQLVTIRRPDKPGAPVERHLVTGFSRPLGQTGAMSIQATSIEDFPEAANTPLPGA